MGNNNLCAYVPYASGTELYLHRGSYNLFKIIGFPFNVQSSIFYNKKKEQVKIGFKKEKPVW